MAQESQDHHASVTEIRVRMDCPRCAKKVTKALLSVPGVSDVAANVALQKVHVTASADVAVDDLLKAVKKTRKSAAVLSHKRQSPAATCQVEKKEPLIKEEKKSEPALDNPTVEKKEPLDEEKKKSEPLDDKPTVIKKEPLEEEKKKSEPLDDNPTVIKKEPLEEEKKEPLEADPTVIKKEPLEEEKKKSEPLDENPTVKKKEPVEEEKKKSEPLDQNPTVKKKEPLDENRTVEIDSSYRHQSVVHSYNVHRVGVSDSVYVKPQEHVIAHMDGTYNPRDSYLSDPVACIFSDENPNACSVM